MSEPESRAACLMLPDGEDDEAERVPARVCVIDLGTNSFHAVIVDAYPNGTFEAVDRIKEMVRLGERGLSGRQLTEEGMDRAIRALERIRLLADGWETGEYLAFATSAIREAENGGDFIRRARKETGIHIRPISGAFEASLIYRGVRRAVDLHEPTLLVDIGGGSTEFIVADRSETYYQASLKLGAARMTERFITTDPIEEDEFQALRAYYRSMLKPVFQGAREHGVRGVVGSSGTMENLAQVSALHYGASDRTIFQQAYDRETMRRVTKQLMRSTEAERREIEGIDDKRVSQVVAGATLLDVILKDLNIEQMCVSPYALREGMVDYYLEENYERLQYIAPFSSVRRRSIYEMAFRFQWEKKHAQHVAALALQLFDACRALHGLGERERELLEYAGLLHDIGYHISQSSHHKHSRYLIKHADLRGFQPEEIDTMAHVARYHRGRLPRKRHKAFMGLGDEHRQRISKLAAFMRLANGLDRSHFQNVTGLHTQLSNDRLVVTLQTQGDPQLERWGGQRGADLFEHVFGRTVEVRAHPLAPAANGTAARDPEESPFVKEA